MSSIFNRNDDFTEKQLKGIDLVVKGCSKKFKFIKGWSLTDTYRNYKSTLYIDLYIDLEEVAKLYKLKVNPFWVNYYKGREEDFKSTTLSVFLTKENGESLRHDKSEDEKYFEELYQLRLNIKNTMNQLYDKLPDEFKIYVTSFGEYEYKNTVTIEADNFINQ